MKKKMQYDLGFDLLKWKLNFLEDKNRWRRWKGHNEYFHIIPESHFRIKWYEPREAEWKSKMIFNWRQFSIVGLRTIQIIFENQGFRSCIF